MARSSFAGRRGAVFLAALIAVVSLTVATAATAAHSTGGAKSKSALTPLPKKTIAFLQIAGASPTAQLIQKDFEAAVKVLGWNSKVIDAQGDPAKMAAAMQAFVTQKVDAVVSLAVQPSIMQQGLKAAKAAHIPVISVGGAILPSPLIAADLAPNEYEFSTIISSYFLKRLPPNAKIAVLELNSENSLRNRAVVFDLIAKTLRPDVKIVARHDGDLSNPVQDSLTAATTAIKANPGLAGIFTVSDFQLPPVVQAIKAAGKTGKILTAAFYLGGGNEEAVASNPSVVGVADNPDGYNSWIAVDQLAGFFASNTPIDPFASVNANLPYRLVTKANMVNGKAGPYSVNIPAKYTARWKATYQLPAK